MNAAHVFAPKPLIFAAIIGGLLYGAIRRRGMGDFAAGALIGAAVQVGVRALKVS